MLGVEGVCKSGGGQWPSSSQAVARAVRCHNMCDSFFKGDLQTALELQREALPLVDALFSEVNPIPVKKAMNLMGMNVGPLRSPMCEMGEDNARKLAEVMKAYGLKLA